VLVTLQNNLRTRN